MALIGDNTLNQWCSDVPLSCVQFGQSVSATAHRTMRRFTKQVERTVLADLPKPPRIAKIARRLGVSERNLRRVFESVHGLPPVKYLRLFRLSLARRALMSARSRSVSVSKVATSLGFPQLGRFSVEYRESFGESPSETLGLAVRKYERRRG
jgi:transcriptional regulator GlxA family with amidase domain